jgi:hypothetical protein
MCSEGIHFFFCNCRMCLYAFLVPIFTTLKHNRVLSPTSHAPSVRKRFYADDQGCSCLAVVVCTDNMSKSATSSDGKSTAVLLSCGNIY